MTRLYGFTYNRVNGCVIAFGRWCFCFKIYLAKVPKRRLKCYYYATIAKGVVFTTKYNCDKFRFFGYISIDTKNLTDE